MFVCNNQLSLKKQGNNMLVLVSLKNKANKRPTQGLLCCAFFSDKIAKNKGPISRAFLLPKKSKKSISNNFV